MRLWVWKPSLEPCGLHIIALVFMAVSCLFLRFDIEDICHHLPAIMMIGTMLSGSIPDNISLILCSREIEV